MDRGKSKKQNKRQETDINKSMEDGEYHNMGILITMLNWRAAGGIESATRIETMFRSNIINSPMLEVDDTRSANYTAFLYDTGLWEGTAACICTNMVPLNVQEEIEAILEGIPLRFFSRDERGDIHFQA